MPNSKSLVSLFSGIGGFELGLAEAGYEPKLFCEIDPHARAVLKRAWPNTKIANDIRELKSLPACDVITAGFPCQDLSQAGLKVGIKGGNSGLVRHLFRLLGGMKRAPDWVIIENVPFMLSLDKGSAMSFLLKQFERLGYRWAYRVIDARSFGLPQRRQRVILAASKTNDPAALLASPSHELLDEKPAIVRPDSAYGFYWTEGTRGLGWVRNAIPPIKGGSGLGIPSAPAIWCPASGMVGQPSIEDAERLQGFPRGWTADKEFRVGSRWRLVGNAVNVETARWLGRRLKEQLVTPYEVSELRKDSAWPQSAFGSIEGRYKMHLSAWPEMTPVTSILSFLEDGITPLSLKAAAGFLKRAQTTPKLVYSPVFLRFLDKYCAQAREALEARKSA